MELKKAISVRYGYIVTKMQQYVGKNVPKWHAQWRNWFGSGVCKNLLSVFNRIFKMWIF